jgi:hypothetical protein
MIRMVTGQEILTKKTSMKIRSFDNFFKNDLIYVIAVSIQLFVIIDLS